MINVGILRLFASSEIALTGATGFIGTKLLLLLTEAGWRVRALYRPKKGYIPPELPGVEWFAGDLKNEDMLNTLVKGTHAVIHCAGAVRGASQDDFDQVNEDGALQVALAAAKQPQIPRFLLISSLAAREPELSHYSGSKWRGECAVKNTLNNLRWTIIRPPAVYGPGDQELLPLFRSISNGFAPTPSGSNGRFSMIYVEDLVMAIVHWLKADAGYGQTFELDDGHDNGYDWETVLDIGSRVLRNGASVRRIEIPISLLKLVAHINLFAAKQFGYSPMLTPGKVREITHSNWLCNSQEFTKTMDWQPTFQLERGLACIFGKKLQN